MKESKKEILQEEEPKSCVGTCFACIPQCERNKSEGQEEGKSDACGKPKNPR